MELDDAYANAAHISDAEQYPPRWTAKAHAFRDSLGQRARLGLPYGDSPRQVLDLFQPTETPIGTVVFVHGGYWLDFDRSFWSHLATGPLARGWSVAMPSYDLCPDVSIAQISQQIARAITAIADMDAGPITLAGHSAGGHLVARMRDRALLNDKVSAKLRAVVPISPLADLRPLLRTSMRDRLRLTPEMAAAESPVLMQDLSPVACNVVVGADERPVFLDQARWLAEAWSINCVVEPARHHFNVIELLEDRDSEVVRALTP